MGQIAGAGATFAAVVTSLWIALSERRPRVALSIQQWLFIGDDLDDDQIGFRVTNQGLQPISVTSYGWTVGRFRKRHAVINHSQDHPFQPPLPCSIQVGQNVMFLNCPDAFAHSVREMPDFFSWSLMGRRYPRKLQGWVNLSFGTYKRVRVAKELRQTLHSLVAELPATKKAGPKPAAAEPSGS